jgi:hypothetical protein
MTNVADKLRTPARKLPWLIGAPVALALAVGGAFGAAALTQPAPVPTPSVVAVVHEGLSPAELVQVQAAADGQAAQIAADAAAALAAQQAADAAAAQQAADALAAQQAAAAAATHKSAATVVGLVKCPAGSQANTGDGGNDTSCFPDICFHITLPDPAHPECVTAFKP